MQALRSLLFNIGFYFWTALLGLIALPALALPSQHMGWVPRLWTRGILVWLRWTVGLDHEIRGRENLPEGAVIIAAKHQSAWDTFVFESLIDAPAYVLKRELMFVPLVGWYMARRGVIPVDRKAGSQALRRMLKDAERFAAAGRPILIYPEGTRTAPGQSLPYHPGIAALYGHLGLPVVPVALNSGLYWGRRTFMKRPGRIVLEILPPIPPGLDRRAFMAELRSRIEEASRALAEEAGRAG